ncbi:hypothetical protein FDP25_05905 [Roseovarius sp. A21]|uniref:Uncharacterized protein n=1 Tax=Roseovarius bejariae TaxID=2576383 RepID=A0A844CWC3_9RHOB|nr:hypothetical protein [Roseovarius bejariae]MRU14960.1 hypothetical protein [Roseovarius bejariae]
MRVVHRGFDTLHLSIQKSIPPDLLEYLAAQKEAAEGTREAVAVTFNGTDFNLAPYGGKGYSFLLEDGPLGAQWAFKKPNPKDPWGVRVAIGSTFLATQGLGEVRAYIADTMDALGMPFKTDQVSIGRADFCVDILAPDFELEPENFAMRSPTNRADHHAGTPDTRSNGKSGRYTSVTVGKMPGRQVIIYDKRAQIIAQDKPIWWDIWAANLAGDGLPPLDRSDAAESRVWRIEVRAGKSLLKDRWQVRTWADFDARLGDIMAEAFEKVQYKEPDVFDTNRSGWPVAPIWALAHQAVLDDLTELRSYMDAPTAKDVYREEQIRILQAQVLGNAITLAALRGIPQEALGNEIDVMAHVLKSEIVADPDRAKRKLLEAENRYRFI